MKKNIIILTVFFLCLFIFSVYQIITYNGEIDNIVYAVGGISDNPDENFPQTNGRVRTIVRDDDTLYIGGSFTEVNGESRNRIARILPDGTVDPNFDPNAGSTVQALALDTENDLIYAGGDFTTIGGESRNRIAAINLTDGTATDWNPNAGSTVNALALDTENDLIYIGGNFTSVGGFTRNRIAVIDTTADTNNLISWNPNASWVVHALALDTENDLIYVGGGFTSIGGQSRSRIAAINTITSSATAWNPNAGNTVHALALDTENDLIYVGGFFTSIGGESRNNIAAINTTTNTNNATAWNPNAETTVHALALDTENDLIYVGGFFTSIGGESRNRIAAINLEDGTATAWNPNVGNTVDTLALDTENNLIYVGGNFTTIGGNSHLYLSRFGEIQIAKTGRTIILSYYNINFLSEPLEGGIVNGQGRYVENTRLTISATPNKGYTFSHWEKDGEIISESLYHSLIVTKDKELTAVFEVEKTEEDIEEIEETDEEESEESEDTEETEETIISCQVPIYLTRPVSFGANNNPEDVKLLQRFLNTYEGYNLPVTGIYSATDKNAVIEWQEKYAEDILIPWGITEGTGYVFTTSLRKIKEIHEAMCIDEVIETPKAKEQDQKTYQFTRNLSTGITREDVKELQQYLNNNGFPLAQTGVGSLGNETNYFGSLTQQALINFQRANNINPAVGYFGPITRGLVNR